MKYKFSVVAGQTNTDGRYTKRPIVEVELSRGAQKRKFLALIDSGADQIIMPAAIAEVFGIEREACPKRSAVDISMERTEGFVGELDFHIQHQADPFSAPVMFIDTDVPVLLGREGFLRPLPDQVRTGSRHLRNHARAEAIGYTRRCQFQVGRKSVSLSPEYEPIHPSVLFTQLTL
jgi:hypothetical protein